MMSMALGGSVGSGLPALQLQPSALRSFVPPASLALAAREGGMPQPSRRRAPSSSLPPRSSSAVASSKTICCRPSSSSCAVRISSLGAPGGRTLTSKVVHLVRHAEGTHNLSEEESKLPSHFDAGLTPQGIEQCRRLARRTPDLDVEAILASPLTRCLETARLSFPHLYEGGRDGDDKTTANVPFVAIEDWRETVNFLCDARRPTRVLEGTYPRVCFGSLRHDHDALWSRYEELYGSHEEHTSMRESADPASLFDRAHEAWKTLLMRPEREVALVGHSAFFKHMFTPLFVEMEGVVRYEDDAAQKMMTAGAFENCELRTVVVDVPEIL